MGPSATTKVFPYWLPSVGPGAEQQQQQQPQPRPDTRAVEVVPRRLGIEAGRHNVIVQSMTQTGGSGGRATSSGIITVQHSDMANTSVVQYAVITTQ